ncbi:MAG TPA: hypothetical protein VMG98_03470 [Verrucomicrobiae bacterium]|nr:hypothetical protein [Verrucomicrobiae bacterium]
MQQAARLLALLFTAMLLLVSLPAGAREVELPAYSATPASDGSVQLILDFDGFAPQIVLSGTSRAAQPPPGTGE